MGRRLVIAIDPWFGLLPDKPKPPVRFTPIQIVDATGQPMSPGAHEAFIAEKVYGGMSPVEIARHIARLQTELEEAKHRAQLPGWYLLALLVAGAYVGVSAYTGEPMAVWIIRTALGLYLLSWIWVAVTKIRGHRISTPRGRG